MSDDGETTFDLESIQEVDHSQATLIFVLGLLSVVVCAFCGPFALYLGQKYRTACAASGVAPDGLGTAGWVLGIIGTVLSLIWLIFLVIYVGFICVYVAMGIIAMAVMALTVL